MNIEKDGWKSYTTSNLAIIPGHCYKRSIHACNPFTYYL